MKSYFIDDIGHFKKIAEEWDRAVDLCEDRNPFLLSGFIETWWRHYSKGRRMAIFVVSDDAGIIGGVPLCIEKGMRRKIVHIGAQAANVTHFFLRSGSINLLEELINALRKRRDWDTVIFQRVLEGDPMIDFLPRINWQDHKNLRYRVKEAGFNGMIDLSVGYEGVIGNLNNRLKRYILRGKESLQRLGDVGLVRVRGAHEVAGLFREYKELSIRSFSKRDGLSAFSNERYGNFFGEILVLFEKTGRLDAHKLTAGASTLGISFGYRMGPGFKWILTAYNPDYESLRPGHLLLDFLIREAIKNKDPYFDMYYGGEVFYKRQWCNKMIPLKTVEIFRKNILNASIIKGRDFAYRNPGIMNLAKKGRLILRRIISEKKSGCV